MNTPYLLNIDDLSGLKFLACTEVEFFLYFRCGLLIDAYEHFRLVETDMMRYRKSDVRDLGYKSVYQAQRSDPSFKLNSLNYE
jgi:hypothetical protein